MRHRIFFLLTGLSLLSLGSSSGCGGAHDPAGAGGKAPMVRVSHPIEKKVPEYVYFTGRTDAVENVELRARVTGYLVKIDFDPGKEVTEDKVLFQIDPRPYKATWDQAKSQVALNVANYAYAKADLARAKELEKTNALSKQELEKIVATEAQASASLNAANANLESAALNLEFTNVKTPIPGIVGRNLLTIGNLVSQDSTLLTTIVSVDKMYVYFDVDERTMLNVQALIRAGKIPSIKKGATTPVDFGLANEGNDYPHKGTIDFVNNQVDTSTGTLQVRGIIKNPPLEKSETRLLTPGLFVRVRVPLGSPHKALLVPQSAIGMDQGKNYLYVVNDKKTIEYRPVIVGAEQGGGLQVIEPIKIVRTKDGVRPAEDKEQGEPSLRVTDEIVVGGLQRIRSGVVVQTKPAVDTRK